MTKMSPDEVRRLQEALDLYAAPKSKVKVCGPNSRMAKMFQAADRACAEAARENKERTWKNWIARFK